MARDTATGGEGPDDRVRARPRRSDGASADAVATAAPGPSAAPPRPTGQLTVVMMPPTPTRTHFGWTRPKPAAVLVRLPGILLAAGALAGGAGFAVAPVLRQLARWNLAIAPETARLLAIGIPIALFVAVFVALAERFLRLADLGLDMQARTEVLAPAEAPPPEVDPGPMDPSLLLRQTEGADDPAPVRSPPRRGKEIDGGRAARRTHRRRRRDFVDDWAADAADDAFDKPPVAAIADGHRRAMIRFLEGALLAIKDHVPRLDPYSTFGIDLFLAGSGARFADFLGLQGDQRLVPVRAALEALGTKAEMVDLFLSRLAGYDEDAKYRAMIGAGSAAMDRFLAEGEAVRTAAYAGLPEAMRLWNGSAAVQAQAHGILTIMFTDLVGSTQMTRELGDVGAQAVVRAHNAIVRGALARHGGIEVKHTGDGIMATFGNAVGAVEAAVRVQRDVARHNAGAGAPPVRVRIGLNAGDVIREENDIFGAPVQMAARACDKAGEGQVFVTATVLELVKGRAFRFEEAGKFALKGIAEPVALHRVVWPAT